MAIWALDYNITEYNVATNGILLIRGYNVRVANAMLKGFSGYAVPIMGQVNLMMEHRYKSQSTKYSEIKCCVGQTFIGVQFFRPDLEKPKIHWGKVHWNNVFRSSVRDS